MTTYGGWFSSAQVAVASDLSGSGRAAETSICPTIVLLWGEGGFADDETVASGNRAAREPGFEPR